LNNAALKTINLTARKLISGIRKTSIAIYGERTMIMKSIIFILLSAFIISGCASSRSGSAYTRDQARQEHSVRLGVVESVRHVQIEGTKSGVGPMAGGAVGAVAGSNVGGGKGAVVGTILGAVGGGIAGAAVEEGATRKDGLEITVRLDNGSLVAIVQEADENFSPGERVRILAGHGASRVTH
jgi:outer membrane lipoprotein SlyB